MVGGGGGGSVSEGGSTASKPISEDPGQKSLSCTVVAMIVSPQP